MDTMIQQVLDIFSKNSDVDNALKQKKYLKNQFEFFGLSSPLRQSLQRCFLKKEVLPNKKEAFIIIKKLWLLPQRELQYFAIDLTLKYFNELDIEDIDLYEFMVVNKPWWDTVDIIASKLIANYFANFRFEREPVTTNWLTSGNIWLQRSCILFQLKYKSQTDTLLLQHVIIKSLGTKEFFINKAIGWALREYSKTNPYWVKEVVEELEDSLSNLSKREALKHLV